MKELTARQQQVLLFIQDFTEENVCPPSVREIAEHFSISIKAAYSGLVLMYSIYSSFSNRLIISFLKYYTIMIF